VRVVICAVLVALLAAGCGGDEHEPLVAESKTAVVRGELTPNVHLFGEPVVARVDLVLNRERFDPDDVRLKTNFDPYERVGETEVTREDIGKHTTLRYETSLRCLAENCVPPTTGNVTVTQTPDLPIFPEAQNRDYQRRYEFPPAVVTAGVGPEAKTLGRVVWPPVRSLSRVNWYDSSVVGQGFPFVAEVTPLPEPDYRLSPTLLGLGLLALAAALFALPAWLVWSGLRRRARPSSATASALSPLERALRLVVWASRRPSVEERREALEALAFELGPEADGDSVERARRQGWSPPSPEPEQMRRLVASLREEDDAPAS
jgi:hypothetical protein